MLDGAPPPVEAATLEDAEAALMLAERLSGEIYAGDVRAGSATGPP
jgi:hypothetical protein